MGDRRKRCTTLRAHLGLAADPSEEPALSGWNARTLAPFAFQILLIVGIFWVFAGSFRRALGFAAVFAVSMVVFTIVQRRRTPG